MVRAALAWLGFAQPDDHHPFHQSHHDHHGHGGHHGHTHGVVDPILATTERGIWAIKWSFLILAITAALQFGVVLLSGSVALLADTIHNVGDAATAIPLWIAFLLARRKPSPRFTYGYGRVEDLAGVAIVLIILFSALVAGYEAIDRFIHPQPITLLPWVAVAGVSAMRRWRSSASGLAGRSTVRRSSPTGTMPEPTGSPAWPSCSGPGGCGWGSRWPTPSSAC
jgi:hypothetical protein